MVVAVVAVAVVVAVVLGIVFLPKRVGGSTDAGTPAVPVGDEMQAAVLAGWDPADGLPPNDDHGMPPEIDPVLGHNGIPATDAKRIA